MDIGDSRIILVSVFLSIPFASFVRSRVSNDDIMIRLNYPRLDVNPEIALDRK